MAGEANVSEMGNVLVIHPDHTSVERIDMRDYRELTRLVNGNLGMCTLPRSFRAQGFFCYCDDDALVRGDPPPANAYSAHLGKSRLRGPLVIVRADEAGNEHGLSAEDLGQWQDYLAGPPSREAYLAAREEAAWWQIHPGGFFAESFDSIEDFIKKMGG